ncbi:hypothetical protein DRJ22_02050 [Candidatus Woesearchaeota archaeon]|nr:MAG: hypothetical protein B6U93_02300 [Candidatus Woesearchaeota archaeon ex4484_78]RLE46405.1 MAG: hypothetical protein DRJ22_02050 [Candidatus Woesearchaeota archaeon]
MVFEQLYPVEFLRKHSFYGFLLGVGYTILGMFIALMIFREDPALIAVGITSLLLIPSLYNLSDASSFFKRGIDFRSFFRFSFSNVKIYVFIFFGIFFTFAFFSILLPSLAANYLFNVQLSVVRGSAVSFSFSLFWDLFSWNLRVLLLAFLLSLIAGNGAILFIAWNASVWGTIFGNLAKTAAVVSGGHPAIIFLLIILSVFPHTFLEGLSYILATVSGTALSDGLVREKAFSRRMWLIFKYGFLLALISVGVLLVAGVVETYVLNNFHTYRMIIELAFPR